MGPLNGGAPPVEIWRAAAVPPAAHVDAFDSGAQRDRQRGGTAASWLRLAWASSRHTPVRYSVQVLLQPATRAIVQLWLVYLTSAARCSAAMPRRTV